MKIRILCIVCVATAAASFAGCVPVYKNTSACERMMRTSFAGTSSDKLSVDHTGTGIYGTRVVVEGTIAHLETASATVAASVSASAVSPASGASAVPASSSLRSVKPKKTLKPAAVECTFNEKGLTSFRWLAPAELVKSADGPSSD